MFKKLRNKFLILNMTLISILLIGAFCVVFMMVYKNTNNSINIQLDRGISFFQPWERGNNNRFGEHRFMDAGNADREEVRPVPAPGEPEMNEVSTIKIDENGSVLETRSSYDYDQIFYETIIESALNSFNKSSNVEKRISYIIKFDNVYYKYLITSNIEIDDGIVNPVYYISICNINTRIDMLKSLVLTLIIVLLAALIFVFLICLFFANRSIKPIEEAWDKQNQFIADASHELKTPLTVINTNVDVLLAHGDSTINQEKKWLNYIKDESARMAKLTNDLLYLAKVDHSAENNIIKSVISFSLAAESVILNMEAVIYEKNLILSDKIEEDIYIKGDLGQIKQLIMILLDNAVKYTNDGGAIDICLKRIDNKARLSVKNTGDGIFIEDSNRIFDRFYRSDKSRTRKSGGYGLGLAIARSIVMSHRGNIRLKSEPNHYAEFIVEIPLSGNPKDYIHS